MSTVLRDLKYAVRTQGKTIGVTVIVIMTLALGVGANTAIFSVVNAVLLRPEPYPASNQLVDIQERSPGRSPTFSNVSLPDFLDWKSQTRSFETMAAYKFKAFAFTRSSGALRIEGWEVTPDFFAVMGQSPVLGRFFAQDEEQPGRDQVLVLSERFWINQLGRDPDVLTKPLRIDGRQYSVVGVVGSNFAFPLEEAATIWKPLPLTPQSLRDRSDRLMGAVARLKKNASIEQARLEMNTIAELLAKTYPDSNGSWTIDLAALHERTVADDRALVLSLLVAVFCVMLIACVNIATLLAVRAAVRQREVGIRIALGATRRHVVQQVLTESMLLSLVAGTVGVFMSFGGLILLKRYLSDTAHILEAQLDVHVLLFALGLSAATGLLLGMVPAWQMVDARVAAILRETSRGASIGTKPISWRNAAVVTQVTLTMVLLTSFGLLFRSLAALRQVDPGFRKERVLLLSQLVLPPEKYDNARTINFFRELLNRIRALPGVEAAGGVTALPLTSTSGFNGYEIVGHPLASPSGERAAVVNVVTEDYFRTMGIPLLKGRVVKENDDPTAARIALINEVMARRDFADGVDPIGQRLVLHTPGSPTHEIVGIVGSTRQFELDQEPSPEIFTPYQQSDLHYMYVVVRSAAEPNSLFAPIRQIVREIDPDQPVGHRTLEQELQMRLAAPQSSAFLFGSFAVVALLLAAIGIYGVLSYSVTQRTKEIGIRMALGAPRTDILKKIFVQGLRLTLLGILLGLVGAFVAGRFIASLLYTIKPTDWVTFVVASVLLLAVALLACYLPASRAMRVDPLITLHHE